MGAGQVVRAGHVGESHVQVGSGAGRRRVAVCLSFKEITLSNGAATASAAAPSSVTTSNALLSASVEGVGDAGGVVGVAAAGLGSVIYILQKLL